MDCLTINAYFRLYLKAAIAYLVAASRRRVCSF